MKKKALSVVLASAMTASMLLSGCGNTDAPASSETQPSSEAQSEASSEAPAEESNLLPALSADEQGKMGDCTTPRSNYVQYPYEGAEGVTLTYWLPVPSNVQNHPDTAESVQMTEWAQEWQRLTGITVEFIGPTTDTDTNFNLMTTDTKLPDIVEWEWSTSYPGGPSQAYDDGMLIYLNDYIKADGPAADLWQWLQDNPHVDKSIKDDNGNYYCFPFVRGSKYLQCTSGLIYRKDLLEKSGYTGSLETIDDWTAAMTALKDSGVETPMTYQDMNYLMNGTFNAYSIRPGMYLDDKDGKVHYGFIEESYKDWMIQMNEWVKAGLLDANVPTNKSADAQQKMLDGTSAVTYGAGGSRLGTWNKTAWKEPDTYGADYELVAAQFPVLTAGTTVKYGGASYDYATTSKASASITADCENPEIAAAFLNFCYSQTGHYAINFGTEGVSYTLDADGNAQYTDLIMNNPDGLSVAVAMAHYGRGNMSGAFVQDPNYIFGYYAQQQQKDALYMWNDGTDSQSTLIPPVTMTADEANEYAELNSKISTAVGEYRVKWYNMESDVSADWDAYVAQIGPDVERMIEIYQAAVDRYQAR